MRGVPLPLALILLMVAGSSCGCARFRTCPPAFYVEVTDLLRARSPAEAILIRAVVSWEQEQRPTWIGYDDLNIPVSSVSEILDRLASQGWQDVRIVARALPNGGTRWFVESDMPLTADEEARLSEDMERLRQIRSQFFAQLQEQLDGAGERSRER